MSLSNPTNTNVNPAIKFFQWSGDQGVVKYYDKEKSENVFLQTPFKFIVLDTLSTVTGYSDTDNSGFWSNEVRSIKSEPFVVKTRNGVKKEGLWSEIGEGLKSQGAKFATSVYIAYFNKETKEIELCNFKFFGSSITQWIEFLKNNRGPGVSIVGNEEAKKGRTTYYTPVFEALKVNDEQLSKAISLDQELQKYLDKYFDYSFKKEEKSLAVSAGSEDSFDTEEVKVSTTDDDDIPF